MRNPCPSLRFVGSLFAALAACSTPLAAQVQIGDFRLVPGNPSTITRFHDIAGFTTRSVVDAPLQIPSAFTGTSGAYDSVVDVNDMGLVSYTANTQIDRPNRFGSVRYGAPGLVAGAMQWSFSLQALAPYLATHQLDLTSLTFRLNLDTTTNAQFDIFLAYSGPSGTPAGIAGGYDTADSQNYTSLIEPAGLATVGDLIGGSFVLLLKDQTADIDFSHNLLNLYNSGMTEFNLIIASGAFWGTSARLNIIEGSGLFVETVAIPEPSTVSLSLVAGAMVLVLVRRRRS